MGSIQSIQKNDSPIQKNFHLKMGAIQSIQKNPHLKMGAIQSIQKNSRLKIGYIFSISHENWALLHTKVNFSTYYNTFMSYEL